MPKYFDIHSHLNSGDYKDDLDAVIGRLKETGTHTIVVGTDYDSSEEAVKLADKYEEIYACIGIHPSESKKHVKYSKTSQFDEELKKFEELARHPKVVAIGECGLDFFHQNKAAFHEKQRQLFLDQVEFALTHDLPIMIHSRDAYEELLDILEPLEKEHGAKLHGNVHFFAGDVGIARRFLNMDFTLSFTGVITFARDYDEVIKFASLDRIMSETDAPYVAPAPYRGKRNEPSYVSEVVKKIAEIRGEDFEHVRETLVNNALRMIG